MSEFIEKKLRFLVSPTRFYPEHLKADMDSAYKCWRSVWGQALTEEMNVKDALYADNFSRQSHVAVLFYGDEPFALTTLNFMNLNDPLYQDDSYFKVWPLDAVAKLKADSTNIMTCCNVTLNFKFRKNSFGVSGKDLMLAMLVQYLKASELDSIVAAVRLEKGMEKASYRTGAASIQRDLPYSIPGQRVDLVIWKKNLDLSHLDPEIKKLSQAIWTNSSVIVERQFFQGEKHVA
jgi:hypothetical protein